MGGGIILHYVEAGRDLTANGEAECPIHKLDICILKVSKMSVALHGSHLANMQMNINNSVIELNNGIIRHLCKHILMLDLKYENAVPSVI